MERDRYDDRAKDDVSPLPPPVTCCWTRRLSALCHPIHASSLCVGVGRVLVHTQRHQSHNGKTSTGLTLVSQHKQCESVADMHIKSKKPKKEINIYI